MFEPDIKEDLGKRVLKPIPIYPKISWGFFRKRR